MLLEIESKRTSTHLIWPPRTGCDPSQMAQACKVYCTLHALESNVSFYYLPSIIPSLRLRRSDIQ
ncbi:hypothetical protein PT7_3520 [Pusillimonas sp. T7-7]|nr:hypothetical protein PT7_3520 [Pusillimonas sp. T7-7]